MLISQGRELRWRRRRPDIPRYNTATVAHFFLERGQPDDELVFRLLGDETGAGAPAECAPPMDVLETSDGIEIVMDVPGVPASAIRLLFSQGTVIVAGRKTPGACAHREAAFHLVERTFGRFARAVRLTGAFDAGRAAATLSGGELRIRLPKVDERRGRDIRIPITQS